MDIERADPKKRLKDTKKSKDFTLAENLPKNFTSTPAPPVQPAQVDDVVVGKPDNFKILHQITRRGVIIEEVSACSLPGAVLVKYKTPNGVALQHVQYVQVLEDKNGGHYLSH
jgi:hypothetical protein